MNEKSDSEEIEEKRREEKRKEKKSRLKLGESINEEMSSSCFILLSHQLCLYR